MRTVSQIHLLYHYKFYFKDVNQFEVGPHERLLNTQYDLNKYKETTDEVIRGTSIRVDKTGSLGPCPLLICTGFLKYPFGHLFQTAIKIDFKTN